MPIEIGPVQLIVFGFDQPKFGGAIAAELTRLKELGLIRVVDALVVHKNKEGIVRSLQITDLEPEQAEGFGAILGGLVGLGIGGEEGARMGAAAAIQEVEERGGHLFDPDEWEVLEDIPHDTAAALLLLEHRWAIPLRDAVRAEGGAAIGDIWLHPRDLVAAGLAAAEVVDESKQQAA
jgi:uncharacterized membrane protein